MRQRQHSGRILGFALLGIIALMAVFLAGCGGSSQSSDPVAGVHKTAHDMVQNLLKGDYEGACQLYSRQARSTFGKAGCAKSMGALMLLGGEKMKAQVQELGTEFDSASVTVNGTKAVMRTPHGAADFVFEEGIWRVVGGMNVNSSTG